MIPASDICASRAILKSDSSDDLPTTAADMAALFSTKTLSDALQDSMLSAPEPSISASSPSISSTIPILPAPLPDPPGDELIDPLLRSVYNPADATSSVHTHTGTHPSVLEALFLPDPHIEDVIEPLLPLASMLTSCTSPTPAPSSPSNTSPPPLSNQHPAAASHSPPPAAVSAPDQLSLVPVPIAPPTPAPSSPLGTSPPPSNECPMAAPPSTPPDTTPPAAVLTPDPLSLVPV